MIEILKEINQKLLKKHKDKEEELKKYQLMQKILEIKNCFTSMKIEDAYAILRDLQLPEEKLKQVYIDLIN